MTMRLGVLVTHPIQYYAPWYRALAASPGVDLTVFFSHHQSAKEQAAAGYGVAFDWDVPVLEGYSYRFLENRARFPSVSRFWGCDTPGIKDEIRHTRWDAFIVQGWNTRSYWQAISACRAGGIPVLVRGDSHLHTRRSLGLRLAKYPIYRSFIPRFDAYLYVGTWNREYYLHYGADPKRMFHVPHSVDNAFFQERAQAAAAGRVEGRAALGIPADAVVFLFAGRLVAAKRPMDFLAALQRLQGSPRPVAGVVVGDGVLRGAMEAFVRRHGLSVRFLGFRNQSQIPASYALADCLVLPSRVAETWGLVVNEGMASGLPAIVSDGVGCAPDLLRAGETGFIYPAQDIEALSDRMKVAVSSPERLAQMGLRAQERVASFSVKEAVKGTLEAARFVLKNR